MKTVSHLTIGLDLGDKTSEVCVLDERQCEVRRGPVKTDPASLAELFCEFPGATLVFEVGRGRL